MTLILTCYITFISACYIRHKTFQDPFIIFFSQYEDTGFYKILSCILQIDYKL